MTSGLLYEPLPVDEVTLVTVGTVVSMIIASFAPRLLAAPGVASVRVAFVPVTL